MASRRLKIHVPRATGPSELKAKQGFRQSLAPGLVACDPPPLCPSCSVEVVIADYNQPNTHPPLTSKLTHPLMPVRPQQPVGSFRPSFVKSTGKGNSIPSGLKHPNQF